MALFQYFGWVGGFLLVALFAANWFFSSPIAPAPASDVPLNQGINIRIHTEHKWPERVVFDSTSSMLVPEAKANTETEIGGSEMPAQAERQLLDAFAQMRAMPVKPCFRPTCSGGQPAEREASPLVEDAPSQNRARKIARKTYFPQSASQAARKKLTRSPRYRLCPSSRVFDRPAPAASPQSGRPRRLRKARHLKIARV